MALLDPIPSPVENADFAALEWEPLLALVAGFSASPVGRAAILSLAPSTDEEWIARQHQLTGELRLAARRAGFHSRWAGLFDPTQLAAKAQIPGAALEAAELQAVARLANDVASWQSLLQAPPVRLVGKLLGTFAAFRRAGRQQPASAGRDRSSAPFSPTARWPTTPRPNWAAFAATRSASSELIEESLRAALRKLSATAQPRKT